MPGVRTASASSLFADPVYRYTKYCLVPVGLAVTFEGLAWLTGDVWLHVLAALCFATVVVACVEDPRVSGLGLTVEHPTSTTVGERSQHRFTVTNHGRRWTSTGHLRHHAHGLADVSVLLPRLAPGQSVTLEVPRLATRRGVTPGHVALVSSSAPYGLRFTTATARLMAPLVVWPALTSAPPVRPRERTDGRAETAGAVRHGETVRGLRDWRSGDDARQVHWRSSARRGQLVVVEREAPRQARVTLLAVGPLNDARGDRAVATLATAAVQAIHGGDLTSLWSSQPGLERLLAANRESALDWCAALDDAARPSTAILAEVADAAGPGGAVHVVAPSLTQEEWDALRAELRPYAIDVIDLESLPGAGR